MKVAVLGSGAGALAVAADMSGHGRDTVLADFDDFRANLEPVTESGGVTAFNDWHGAPVEPATAAAGGLDTGYITDGVPCALVLASSLGEAAGVPTPAIDELVAAASSMLGRDFRAEGPTLATLGLGGLDVTGLVGFARTGVFP